MICFLGLVTVNSTNMFSLSYHFTNVQDSFSSSYCYQQAFSSSYCYQQAFSSSYCYQQALSSSYCYQQAFSFSYCFSSTYSEFPAMQQSNVLYTSVQSEYQWNNHLYKLTQSSIHICSSQRVKHQYLVNAK